jgi:putative membrane-bound dehydrogenase-like protein
MTRGFFLRPDQCVRGKVQLMHDRFTPTILGHVIVLLLSSATATAAPPRVTDDRYELERVAIEPEIVTPTGMTFDSQGRLLVIESHTHERQSGYEGPERDRIRMFTDSNGDGRLDKWSTFAEGFRHAMNLLGRQDGAVYVVERGRLLLLRDTKNDGTADSEEVLLRLETQDDYPHNALGGIAQENDGTLVLGLGENHGLPFRLIGADGKVFTGTGGLDGFFRCTADGKDIKHFARGVWNPFSLCIVPDGRIFAVDNDPDASPPCRLLHVVDDGDYGYLYQYGRAGTHPLQAWNGELPGTLPMVCGTGEAPTAIVPHAGSLWVTSWGEHCIERYNLVPRGASYGATRKVIVQGGPDFRPTGMAVAPDGSIYFGDWVLRDYAVHGKGRIWRLVLTDDDLKTPFPASSVPDVVLSKGGNDFGRAALLSHDPFEHVQGLTRLPRGGRQIAYRASMPPRLRLGFLEKERLEGSKPPDKFLRRALADESWEVRLYAVRWIADERTLELRDDIAKLLESPPPSTRFYMAVLAALDWLDAEPSMRGRNIADELLIKELNNDSRSPETHALALRLVRPNIEFLTHDRLREWMKSDHQPLRVEAVRTLQQRTNPKRLPILAEVAGEDSYDDEMRAEAIVGLAADAQTHQPLLEKLANDDNAIIKREASRVLRLTALQPVTEESKPAADDTEAWTRFLSVPGDADAGRRLFFMPAGPRCAACHQYDGRGGRIGPDLTHIGRSTERKQIILSILQPSREVAPHYQPWILTTDDGKTHIGLRQPQGGDNGVETYVDSAGNEFQLPSATIEVREASDKSIMPDGLQSGLTIEDLRDLVTFLTATK